MGLPKSIVKEFAKQAVEKKPTVDKPTQLVGTVQVEDGQTFVYLDGSNGSKTPVSETVAYQSGDRVLVSIQNRKATIIGNYTDPSINQALDNVIIEYALSSSSVSFIAWPGEKGEWNTIAPEKEDGSYMWQRTTKISTNPLINPEISLTCIQGSDGKNGYTPYIGSNGNWWINGVDTGYSAEGDDGHSPYVDTTTNTWWEWDADIGNYHDTGIVPQGPGVFKSIVFKRFSSPPSTPTGGSYLSPVPSGWSDGIPSGTEQIWISTRVFTSDGESPQTSEWTTPQMASDIPDIDFEYSWIATNPGNPTDNPGNWSNEATENSIWMAVRKKSRGAWGSWEISKIKGEMSAEQLAQLNQASEDASQAKTDVANLEIGGRNLLLNSGFKNNADGWDYPAYISEYVVKDGRKCAHINHSELNTIKFARQSILGKLEPNTQYTMSGWVFTENVVKGTTNFMCMFRHDGQYDNNGTTDWYGYGHKEFPVNAGKWTHVEWTFTTDSEHTLNAISSNVYVYTRDMTGDIYFCDLKLEKGNKATDWTPAPEDVDAGIANVQTDINTLSDKTRSGYIETLSGTGFVQSTKTEDGGTAEIVVYGKSNQKVTQQSANLCPTYDKWTLSGGAYIDGDYIVFPSNGATAVVDVHWKKASNTAYFHINCKRDGDDAASLIIKADNGNGWAKELQTDETTYNHSFGGNNVYGDTLLEMTYVRFTLMHYQTATGSMRIKNFMVSSTNIPYVPFVPDSPSPEYPSEIQSVENPKVTVTAKNLLGGEALANVIVEKGGSKNSDDKTVQWQCSVVLDKSITESISFKENTQYSFILYGKCLNDSAPYANIKILYTDGSITTGLKFTTAGEFSYAVIVSTAGKTIKDFSFSWYAQGTILEYEKCGLFEGVVNTEQFEPYKGKTATLSDIVLRSTPDGTRDKLFKDIDGLWKVDRKYGVVDLGTLTWTYVSTGTRFNAELPKIKNVASVTTKANIVCPLYVAGTPNDTWNNKDNVISANTDSHLIFVRDTAYTDATTFKSAMSGIMAVYELATQTYETLPDNIQAELNALTTYNPITNVIVSDGVTPDIDVSFWTRDYYAKNAAENAAKVATNFLGYDSTNGLIIGNKASGAWSGYRSQILPDSFNILDESSTVLASFGTTTVIGEEAKANMHLTFNNLSMVDANGTEFFKVGDTRNADGIATLKSIATPYIDSTGSVTLIFESSISSVISVYVNSVELSSSNYSVSGKRITFRNLTPNSRPTIETTFTTTEPSFYLTFGNRLSSGKTGKYSVAEGKDVIASGFASRAEGVNTEASGEYSHAGGYHTKASGDCSYAGGYWTVADGDYVTAIGRYNRKYTGINDKVFVIGNGSSDTNRSNALAVDWNGNLTLGTPLSVENGGTGATTAAAARANLEIYQRELVWDNANDTQKFAAQTIALDLSSYDYAEVHFFVSSTYDERVVGIGIIHERASHIYAQVMSNVDTSDTPIYVTQRVADVSANGVTFSDAYTKFITSTSTQQNNNRMVPTKIYAFKALEA